jgi:hypothetical protein
MILVYTICNILILLHFYMDYFLYNILLFQVHSLISRYIFLQFFTFLGILPSVTKHGMAVKSIEVKIF